MNFNVCVRHKNMFFKNNSTGHVGFCINTHLGVHLFGIGFVYGTKFQAGPLNRTPKQQKCRTNECSSYITVQETTWAAMTSCKVIGRILLATDQLLGVKELAVGAGAHLIHDCRLLSSRIFFSFSNFLLFFSFFVCANLTLG